MRVPGTPAVMIGSAALGAAALLLVTVVGRSLLSSPALEPVEPSPPAAIEIGEEMDPRGALDLDPASFRDAVGAAPFDPTRTPPGERYRMPGELVYFPEVEMPEREPEPPPAFELLGTAASGDGGLAIIRLESETPQFVSTGETMNGYRVSSIEAGRVMMTNDERTLSLSVASASPTPQPEERGRSNRRGRDDDDDDDDRRRSFNDQAERMMEQASAVNTQLQRIQSLPPEQRAAAMQQLQQRLMQGNGNMRVQVDGDRVRVIATEVDGQGVSGAVEQRITPVFRARTPVRDFPPTRP